VLFYLQQALINDHNFRFSGYRKVVGDDASKNGDFERVKQRLQGYKKFQMCYFIFSKH
jgi:hypothetical protein